MRTSQWSLIGSTGTMDTNIGRQIAAGTVTYIPAPTQITTGQPQTNTGKPYPLQNIIIWQIDWDNSIPTTRIIVGDGTATEGTDRIAMEKSGLASNTEVFPNGFYCGPGKAVSVSFNDSGDGVNSWVKITYTLS